VLYRDITDLIGNTSLLRLDPARHGLGGTELYAKLELCNPCAPTCSAGPATRCPPT